MNDIKRVTKLAQTGFHRIDPAENAVFKRIHPVWRLNDFHRDGNIPVKTVIRTAHCENSDVHTCSLKRFCKLKCVNNTTARFD